MRKALKLALEALETCCAGDYSTGHVIDPSFDEDAVNEAIYAIKEALAPMSTQCEVQPEQEVDWKDQYDKQKRRAEMWRAKLEEVVGPLPYAVPLAQPEQEPVAFSCLRCVTPKKCTVHGCSPNTWPSESSSKRPWVELTDEEASWCQAPSTIQTWKRIEAKLKEKNT